jgi:hypothetical protein
MARIFVDYVPDKIIIEELRQYHAYEKALRRGIPEDERPVLPQPEKVRTSRLFLGVLIHSANYLLLRLSKMLGAVKAQERLAGSRIRTDEYSSEPMSCGIHRAYTAYGLARLAQDDVPLAIQSMIYSVKVHPCSHTVTYGLSYALRNELVSRDEAGEAVYLFDVVATRYGGQEWYKRAEDPGDSVRRT